MVEPLPSLQRRLDLTLRRRTVLTAGAAAAGGLLLPGMAHAGKRSSLAPSTQAPIRYTACTSSREWRVGQSHGVRILPATALAS
jgi:hypothetical protein